MPDDVAPADPRPTTAGHSMPKWVKVTAIAAAVLVVAVIILMLATGGHGPGRHGP